MNIERLCGAALNRLYLANDRPLLWLLCGMGKLTVYSLAACLGWNRKR